MNRIVLIGNGFDLAHGLKTRYEDFIDWYWDYRVNGFKNEGKSVSKDILCTIEDRFNKSWRTNYFNGYNTNQNTGIEIIEELLRDKDHFKFTYSPFFENMYKSIETKGWVDIENEYYNLLKMYALDSPSEADLTELNKQIHYIQEKLIEYLGIINKQEIKVNQSILKKIYAPIKSDEISIEGNKKLKEYIKWWAERNKNTWEPRLYHYGITDKEYIIEAEKYQKVRTPEYPDLFMLPESIMLLSFNYTNTAQLYLKKSSIFNLNYIHGEIQKPQSVIFGYGDELDENFKRLKEHDDKECQRNVKSIKYLESDNYRKVLSFIESAPYQVCIMGHSCGKSDRTLLNTLFEHKNCISIKPYYYIKDNRTDNYLELVQNISRNFTDMKLMRDRVVNKLYCEPLLE